MKEIPSMQRQAPATRQAQKRTHKPAAFHTSGFVGTTAKQNRARALRGEKLLKCRAPEPKTQPHPWGVATRMTEPWEAKKWVEGVSPEARARAGPRAALRSRVGTIQSERTAFRSRGRRSGAAAAGFVTEPWEARKWLEGVSPETRPPRRSDPKDEPTGANDGGFSLRAANQPERIWNGLTEAECGPVAGKTKRAGPARAFRAGPASDQGGGRWGGAASAGVFPGGWVWGFRGRQPRPGFSEPRRRPRAVGYVPLSPVSLFRTGQIEWPRVAPR